MNKGKLLNFISKFNLSCILGDRSDNSVILNSDGKNLSTKFKAADGTILGVIKATDLGLDEGEFGIYDASKLEALVKLMQDEFNIIVEKNGGSPNILRIKDDVYSSTYMLCDPEIIPEALKPTKLSIPEMDVTIEMNKIFIDKYLKSFSALSSQLVAFASENGKLIMIMNYSNDLSHNIKFDLGVEYELAEPMVFDANKLKDIFNANRDLITGRIEINEQGLLILKFGCDSISANYFLMSLKLN